jgi:hypothetical protein
MIEHLNFILDGIVVGGQMVNAVRLADDRCMVSSTERGLQKLMYVYNSPVQDIVAQNINKINKR